MIDKFKLNGCIKSPFDANDYICKDIIPNNLIVPKNYKSEYNKVLHQGHVNSCVAHTCANITHITTYKEENIFKDFSVGFVYGNRKNGYWQGEGMIQREAMKILKNNGICEKEMFDYNIEVPRLYKIFNDNINNSILSNAKNYRITSYYTLNNVNDVKKSLFLNGACTIGVKIKGEEFYHLNKENYILHDSKKGDKVHGGHCMTVIGYTEIDGKVYYIVLNSWGENWGNSGEFLIAHDNNMIFEMWGITDKYLPSNNGKWYLALNKKPIRSFKQTNGKSVRKIKQFYYVVEEFFTDKNKAEQYCKENNCKIYIDR